MLAQEDQLMLIKGKRTKRARPASPLPLPLSLSTSDDLSIIATSSSSTTTTTTEEEEDMAHCLILLAQGPTKFPKPDYVYECKTCNRCFPSFQALGGHRASHRRPKSPPAEVPAPENQEPPENIKNEELGLSLHIASADVIVANKPSKVHACAICGAEFSSGQALGGHMRRHRPIGSPAAKAVIAPAPARSLLCLDLNLPAEEQEDQQQESSKFMFTSEKTLVFASSLVDCRY